MTFTYDDIAQLGAFSEWEDTQVRYKQTMIHSNTFGYGFKRVNYMQKLKKTTTLNSTTDSNSFWFEANTVEFEDYICTCLKKVSQRGLQANMSGKNANKCNSPRT